MKRLIGWASTTGLVVALAACGTDSMEGKPGQACGGSGEGVLTIRVWGEDNIEVGIPAADTDGWTITFDRFLLSLASVSAACGDCAPALVQEDLHHVFDLAAASDGAGHLVLSRPAPAGRYDNTAYRVAPASADATAANATAEDVALMVAGGYSVFVDGMAATDNRTVRFAWGFATDTDYRHCESSALLPNGGEASIELTMHGDHLFYDDLVAEEPNVGFAALAEADADADGAVTEAELRAFDLGPLERYQVGSADVDNLWEFVAHLTRTLGHIDGEGHCDIDP